MKNEEKQCKAPNEDIEKLTCEIMTLAMLIHNRTDYCVFINMSGHVGKIEVSIRQSVERYATVLASSDKYFDRLHKDYVTELQAAKQLLISILHSGEIDFSGLDYETEIIKTYTF